MACRLTKQAQEAISCIDRELGLNRAIVVIGYSCIGRCTSIRSNRRVINYIIAGYQKGKTCGDLKQMLMRGAGSTRAVSCLVCHSSLQAQVTAVLTLGHAYRLETMMCQGHAICTVKKQ